MKGERIQTISELNALIDAGKFSTIVNQGEAAHVMCIRRIADLIAARAPVVRLVLVAGPSAAGKTTSAIRICNALRDNGLNTLRISTDDYFVGNRRNPRDAEGNFDYEHIDAVDRGRLLADLQAVFDGRSFHPRKFDFIEHEGYDAKDEMVAPKNAVVVLEGIHALNPLLTAGIGEEAKYRVYVNPLMQLDADRGGWLYYDDTRLMRRIVRDKTYRNMTPENTLTMWPKVSDGETKWINPFRGLADSVFDTSLDYEIAVMAPVLVPLLRAVPYLGGHENVEIHRILKALETVHPVSDTSAIPRNSILRETIGGSEFEYA